MLFDGILECGRFMWMNEAEQHSLQVKIELDALDEELSMLEQLLPNDYMYPGDLRPTND